MSGSIGADRIPRAAVQPTVDWYINILKQYPRFKSVKITGSYNTGLKKDHGDIDLAVYLEGEDMKETKKNLMDFLNSLPDNITVPFRQGRHKGDKATMYADIVTCQVPMQGYEGLLVQIDNAVVLSEEEQTYKKSFLDLAGEKQALLMGLARVILLEENPEKVFKRMGIRKLPVLDKNQELEFVLSPTGLTLRKVTLDGFKETSREDVWKTRDWSYVEKLFKDFDLSRDFDELLSDISAKGFSDRSKSRIRGIVSSTLTIGPGEVGKPKGDNKERAKNATNRVLGEIENPEDTKTVALYGGGFKPPHKAHFANAEKLAKGADRLIIFIGSKVREGVPITAEQSKKIWNVYKDYIHVPVEIRIAEKSPIGSIYELIGNPELKDTKFVIGKSQGAEEDKKFAYLLKNQAKYPNVILKTLPIIADKEDQKFSASTLRKSIEIIRKGDWMPDCLDRDDARKVLDILINPLEQQAIQEEIRIKTNKTLVETLGLKEASSGQPISPACVISSENRQKLSDLYQDINAQLGRDFNVKFNISSITITPRYDGDTVSGQYDPEQAFGSMNESEDDTRKDTKDFDYVPYIVSYCKFLKKNGKKIEPLPEILLNKEEQKGGLLATKTGHYDPVDKVITVYIKGRHPKDVLATVAHELVHHTQCLENRIPKITTDSISEDQNLLNLELEANAVGRAMFRKWLEKQGSYDKVD